MKINLFQLEEEKLSEHAGSCENGKNPYPIYAAVNKQTYENQDVGKYACLYMQILLFSRQNCHKILLDLEITLTFFATTNVKNTNVKF